MKIFKYNFDKKDNSNVNREPARHKTKFESKLDMGLSSIIENLTSQFRAAVGKTDTSATRKSDADEAIAATERERSGLIPSQIKKMDTIVAEFDGKQYAYKVDANTGNIYADGIISGHLLTKKNLEATEDKDVSTEDQRIISDTYAMLGSEESFANNIESIEKNIAALESPDDKLMHKLNMILKTLLSKQLTKNMITNSTKFRENGKIYAKYIKEHGRLVLMFFKENGEKLTTSSIDDNKLEVDVYTLPTRKDNAGNITIDPVNIKRITLFAERPILEGINRSKLITESAIDDAVGECTNLNTAIDKLLRLIELMVKEATFELSETGNDIVKVYKPGLDYILSKGTIPTSIPVIIKLEIENKKFKVAKYLMNNRLAVLRINKSSNPVLSDKEDATVVSPKSLGEEEFNKWMSDNLVNVNTAIKKILGKKEYEARSNGLGLNKLEVDNETKSEVEVDRGLFDTIKDEIGKLENNINKMRPTMQKYRSEHSPFKSDVKVTKVDDTYKPVVTDSGSSVFIGSNEKIKNINIYGGKIIELTINKKKYTDIQFDIKNIDTPNIIIDKVNILIDKLEKLSDKYTSIDSIVNYVSKIHGIKQEYKEGMCRLRDEYYQKVESIENKFKERVGKSSKDSIDYKTALDDRNIQLDDIEMTYYESIMSMLKYRDLFVDDNTSRNDIVKTKFGILFKQHNKKKRKYKPKNKEFKDWMKELRNVIDKNYIESLFRGGIINIAEKNLLTHNSYIAAVNQYAEAVIKWIDPAVNGSKGEPPYPTWNLYRYENADSLKNVKYTGKPDDPLIPMVSRYVYKKDENQDDSFVFVWRPGKNINSSKDDKDTLSEPDTIQYNEWVATTSKQGWSKGNDQNRTPVAEPTVGKDRTIPGLWTILRKFVDIVRGDIKDIDTMETGNIDKFYELIFKHLLHKKGIVVKPKPNIGAFSRQAISIYEQDMLNKGIDLSVDTYFMFNGCGETLLPLRWNTCLDKAIYLKKLIDMSGGKYHATYSLTDKDPGQPNTLPALKQQEEQKKKESDNKSFTASGKIVVLTKPDKSQIISLKTNNERFTLNFMNDEDKKIALNSHTANVNVIVSGSKSKTTGIVTVSRINMASSIQGLNDQTINTSALNKEGSKFSITPNPKSQPKLKANPTSIFGRGPGGESGEESGEESATPPGPTKVFGQPDGESTTPTGPTQISGQPDGESDQVLGDSLIYPLKDVRKMHTILESMENMLSNNVDDDLFVSIGYSNSADRIIRDLKIKIEQLGGNDSDNSKIYVKLLNEMEKSEDPLSTYYEELNKLKGDN